MKRGFRDGVVPAVSFATHALDAAMTFFSSIRKSQLANWIPLSLRTISRDLAVCSSGPYEKALMAEYRSREPLRSHPTTMREKRSMKTVR